MNKIAPKLLILWGLVLCFDNDLKSDISEFKEPQVSKNIQINSIVTHLQIFSEKNNFPIPEKFRGTPKIKKGVNRYYQQETKIVTYGDSYQIERLTSGELLKFSNKAIFSMIAGKSAKVYDEPPPASWPEKKVISTASDFLEAVYDNLDRKEILSPQVRHAYQYRPKSKYYEGIWTVSWSRASKSGYPFYHDRINVKLSEKNGPYWCKKDFSSIFKEHDFAMSPEEDYYKVAHEKAEKIMRWQPAGFNGGRVDKKPFDSKLMIVNPNRITNHMSVHDVAMAREKVARLAWVMWFEWFENEKATKSTRSIEVWIDAENKGFLGGDFAM